MFYSQIILAKKGPLGTVWQAAHWGDRKLGRPAIFATDISATVEHLTSSSSNSSGGGGGGGSAMVPMALRVSGHLLLGVVRIYSRQVQFLRDDCQQAMIKVKMAYSSTSSSSSSNAASSAIDLVPEKGGRGSHSRASHDTTNNSNSQSNSNSNSSKHQQALLNVSHFGEFLDDETLDFLVVHDHHGGGTAGGVDYHTGLPHNENAYYDSTSDDFFVDNNDDWVVPVDSHAQLGVGDPTMAAAVSNTNNNNNNDSMAPNMRDHNDTEEWGVFDPDDDAFATADSEDEEQVEKETNSGREEQRQSELSNKENRKEDEDDSLVSDVELTRAANTSTASDPSGVVRSFVCARC